MDRYEQELDILEPISRILGGGLEIEQTFQRAMALLTQRLGIQRAALLLKDPAGDQLKIVASVGLTPEEQQRGHYAPGEGVTGQVLATGQAAIVPDIARHPAFLNRTGARELDPAKTPSQPIAFICVPIDDGDQHVGAISIDKPFVDQAQLDADARLLKIIAGSFAQTLRLHGRVQHEKNHWLSENQQLKDNLYTRYQFDNIAGGSPVMLDVLATAAQVASSRAAVLLVGEPGVGKQLIAKAIHFHSPRRDQPLIRVNCAAWPAPLLESELFGHVQGAFHGAAQDKIGRVEAASTGTLFLNEISALSPQLQIKLLRMLQDREFERLGDHRGIPVDVRIIAATNLDLEEEVRKGNFREDLYTRLSVVTIHIPPLRSRREDIPRLIDHFLDRANRENNRNLRKIPRPVLNTLLRYPWPGNVRELENAIERAVVLSTGEQFTDDLLPLQIRLYAQQIRGGVGDETIESLCRRLAMLAVEQYQAHEGRVYDMLISQVERQLIREALDANGQVKIRAADFLGINRNTLNKKVKDLNIQGAK